MIPEPTYIEPTGSRRNENCPCGSGLKIKKCCGSIANRKIWKLWSARNRHEEYMARTQSTGEWAAKKAILAAAILDGGTENQV